MRMKVKPCPFCASRKTGLTRSEVSMRRYWVECEDCRAQGPHHHEAQDAIDAWNIVYEESLAAAWDGDEEDAETTSRPPD